jgi:hypothetical protein
MSQVPLARHTKLRRTNPFVGFVKGIAFAVSAVLVAGIGVGAYAYHDYFGTLQDNSVVLSGQDVDPPAVEVLPNDDVNILVTGVDKCEEGSFEQFGARCPQSLIDEQKESYGGQLNDVNMIINI